MRDWNNRLRAARILAGFTLKDVAKSVYISQQTLIQYEKGTVYPKIDILIDLCNQYKVNINYIIYGKDSEFSFETLLQKNIYFLSSLVLENKIDLINDDLIKINDDSLKIYLKYINLFIKEKGNEINGSNVIDAIKKMEKI